MRASFVNILTLLISTFLSFTSFADNTPISTADDSNDANKSNYRHYFQAGYQLAYVLPLNSFIEGENAAGEPINSLQAVRVEFGWQTTGTKRWHQIWDYPSFGIGFTTVDYFNDDEIGTPSAIYGFVSLPMNRWDRWTFSIAPGFGLSSGWKPFDPKTNPYNQSISAYRAAFIDINPNFTYDMARHWDVILALPAYHFSNGGTRKPNNGFNQVGVMASIRYKFEADPRRFKKWDDIPSYKHRKEIVVSGSWGLRNVDFDPAKYNPELDNLYGRVDFEVLTLSIAQMTQKSYTSKHGYGVDLVRDKSTKAQIDVGEGQVVERDLNYFDEYRIGVYYAYEKVIHKLSIIGHLGYSVYQKGYEDQLPRLYQRVGFRYKLYQDWEVGISVRAKYFSSADHLEWTVGRRFKL